KAESQKQMCKLPVTRNWLKKKAASFACRKACMHRRQASRLEHSPAVPTARLEPCHVVSTSGHGEPSEPGSDAADRRAVFANALLRLAAHGRSSGHAPPSDQPQAPATPD